MRQARIFVTNQIIFGTMWTVLARVSEPACFGVAPAPAPGEREHNVGIFVNCLLIV